MIHSGKKSRSLLAVLSGIIGNIAEHYDTALYSFIAPFIAPLFFPTFHPLTALILAYAILPLDLISKPLGAIFFGRIGDRLGRTKALSLSISGTALATGALGFIPVYAEIGPLAPILLASIRFFQKFCSSGECIGGSVYILEHTSEEKKGFLGSLYASSTIIGILFASALTSSFDAFGIIQTHWRWLFFMGFATSGIGMYIRHYMHEGDEFTRSSEPTESLWNILKQYKWPFLAIAASSGLSYATYEVAFIFLNVFPTLVSSVTKTEMLLLNTGLLAFDMLLLPLFGLFADKFSPIKQMTFSAFIILLVSIPMMALCENASYGLLVLIRTIWVILGVMFCAPFHAWSQNIIPTRYRYTVISLGHTIGSQLIGAPFTFIGLWLYKSTNVVYFPGIYLCFAGLLVLGLFKKLEKAQERKPISIGSPLTQ